MFLRKRIWEEYDMKINTYCRETVDSAAVISDLEKRGGAVSQVFYLYLYLYLICIC